MVLSLYFEAELSRLGWVWDSMCWFQQQAKYRFLEWCVACIPRPACLKYAIALSTLCNNLPVPRPSAGWRVIFVVLYYTKPVETKARLTLRVSRSHSRSRVDVKLRWIASTASKLYVLWQLLTSNLIVTKFQLQSPEGSSGMDLELRNALAVRCKTIRGHTHWRRYWKWFLNMIRVALESFRLSFARCVPIFDFATTNDNFYDIRQCLMCQQPKFYRIPAKIGIFPLLVATYRQQLCFHGKYP